MGRDNEKFKYPKRYRNMVENVWLEYSALADKYHPIDLGKGVSDSPAPKRITDALKTVANDTSNIVLTQYARLDGHPRLVKALATLYSILTSINIDPMTDIFITVGALAAMQASIQGIIDDGDEVIVIEPFFDSYDKLVQSAGGIAVYVPLRTQKDAVSASDWILDPNELALAFNAKTKIIILNNPHNPVGKVYSREELNCIADLCKQWDVVCVCDEVYEWMIFDNNVHTRICTLPDMWERTITIGSAGKTFSVTGWSLGWAYAKRDLLKYLHLGQRSSCATPLQEAVAVAFEHEIEKLNTIDSYFKIMSIDLQEKRDFMVTFLINAGFTISIPQGGCFLLANWSHLENRVDFTYESDQHYQRERGKDYRFSKWMIKNLGIQGIPPTIFYSSNHKELAENYIRFCFLKKNESLEKAANIFANWH